MNEKQLSQLLRRCKNTLDQSDRFDAAKKEQVWKSIAQQAGFASEQYQQPAYSIKDYLQYILWKAEHSLARPLTVVATSFTLVFTGWVAALNASANTVPGDFLYPVKLATEQIQLSLANDTQRARLHTEFASRRLEEVAEITSSSRDGKDVRVREAVDGFKQEIASASAGLGQIASQNAEDGVEIAKAVDRRVDEFSAMVQQSDSDPTLADNQDQVQAAIPDVEQTQEQVAEVMIASHEATPQPETAAYLQSSFKSDLTGIQTGMDTTSGRLTAIQSVLDTEKVDGADAYEASIKEARTILAGFGPDITEAMNTFAAGGYRGSLAVIAKLKTDLATVEDLTTTMEIDLSTQPPPAQTPSDTTSTATTSSAAPTF